jgi:DNA-binding SARP family transcriptional activator/tetratricopeptide (TPR) repeat protein
VEFQVLGDVQARADGKTVHLGTRKQRLVAAVLALEANRSVSTERLIDLLWPHHRPASPRGPVHTYISGLRTLLTHFGAQRDDITIETTPSGYLLHCDPQRVDALRFRALLTQAQATTADDLRGTILDHALALWRGPALAGAADGDVRLRLCQDLEEARLTALEERIEIRLRHGGDDNLIDELLTATDQHPYRPRLIGALMLALHRAGRGPQALDVYRRNQRQLADELGLDPPQPLRDLHLAILRDDPGLTRSTAATPAPGVASPLVPRQLPADTTHFTGRTGEQAILAGAGTIHAIDGMPGIGKTALAVHVAHLLAQRYPDGQVFIDLHGHTEGIAPTAPAAALEALLFSVGVGGGQIPSGVDERAAMWRTRLADKRTLIVLDNVSDEAQVVPLLPGSPSCLVLITSRRRLVGLSGAEPLSLDMLSVAEAVWLFAATIGRQQVAQERPVVIDEIVRLCGRLPLAVRVAAARLRHRPAWSPEHLLALLRREHSPLAALWSGQSSVITTLHLSYQHLDADQQRCYRVLSLHPGADIDPQATAVLLDTGAGTALRLLDDLHDAHLLIEPLPGRYRFHDLIRQHAAGLAAQDPDADRTAALTRLFDHYARGASTAMNLVYPFDAGQRPEPPAGPATIDFDSPSAADTWLAVELDNLLATAAHAAAHGRPGHLLHMSATLSRRLHALARATQALSLHEQALTVARDTGDIPGELDALIALGDVHFRRSRYRQADDCFHRALRIARDTGNLTGELGALAGCGEVHFIRSHYCSATTCYEAALRIAKDTGNLTGELGAWIGLGQVLTFTHQHEKAADCFREALRIARATGNVTGELGTLTGLGNVNVSHDNEQAADYFGQVARIAKDTGNAAYEQAGLWGVGHIRYLQSRSGPAAESFERALVIAREIGHRNGELHSLAGLGHACRMRGRHDEAADYLGQAGAIAVAIGDRNAQVYALWGLGHVRHRQGRYGPAAVCYLRALALAIEVDARHGQFEAHHGLAAALHAIGHHTRALSHEYSALDLATDSADLTGQARAHDGLAGIQLTLGRTDRARHHWQVALHIAAGVEHTTESEVSTTAIHAKLAEL